MDTTPARVLVIGDLMLDRYLWGACDRISPEAPVPVVDVRREDWALGGAGNVAANLRALGAEVALVSVTGQDVGHRRLVSLLTELGVRVDGLVVDPTRPVTVKTRVMAAHHQLMRFDVEQRQAIAGDTLARVQAAIGDAIGACQAVVLSDYDKGVLTPEICQEVIAAARQRGIPVVIDPKGRDYRKYRGATIITPNRKEASEAAGFPLADEPSLIRAGHKLRADFGLDACLITLSEDGMALFSEQGTERIPTRVREVFDVTGAGDTVVAALCAEIAEGRSLVEACRFANLAAGVVVGKLGAANATRAEVERFARSTTGAAAEAKIVELTDLLELLPGLRAGGKRVAFTNGCFDILHAGHVLYLERAAELADVLVVGVNSDASVRRIKGEGRPVNPEQDRLFVLAGLASVTFVVKFEEDTPMGLIEGIRPDVLVKGGDYEEATIVGAPFVRAYGGVVTTVPLYPGRSTTRTIERMQRESSS